MESGRDSLADAGRFSRSVNELLYTIAYLVLAPLFKALYGLEVRGLENVGEAPLIFAANHKSYLDPIIVGIPLYPRKLNFMAKSELWGIPILAQLITALGAYPVKRGKFDRRAIAGTIDILKGGGNVLMFPEGTRIRRPGLGAAFKGVASISMKSGAPVVPVGITGAERILPEGRAVPRFPRIAVSFGKPIDPADYGVDKNGFMEDVMKEIARLSGYNGAAGPGEEVKAEVEG